MSLIIRSMSTFSTLSTHEPIRDFSTIHSPIISDVSQGITCGELRKPSGICVEPVTQRIYVAELYTREVKVYSESADFIFKFPLSTQKVDLLFPYNLTIVGAFVFVSDYDTSRVGAFSLVGDFITYLSGGLFRIQYAKGITSDRNGDVYVCDSGNNRVIVFSHTPPCYFQYLHHELRDPKDINVVNDRIYVLDFSDHCLKVFAFTGELIASMLEGIQFYSTYFDINNGYFIFSDQTNDRIVVYSPCGEFVQQIGRKGMCLPGEFNIPRGVAVGANSRIVTVSLKTDYILQIF